MVTRQKRLARSTAENQAVRVRLRSENHQLSPMKRLMFFLALIVLTGASQNSAEDIPKVYFKLWGTHKDQPQYTEKGFVALVGTAEKENYLAAQGKNVVNAEAFSFHGRFEGGKNAIDCANEPAVFLATDVKTSRGNEFRLSLGRWMTTCSRLTCRPQHRTKRR